VTIDNFVNILPHSASDLESLLACAKRLKSEPQAFDRPLSGYTVGMILQKPSMRTRVSFEVGLNRLGGHLIQLSPTDIGFGTREPLSDMMGVLSRYCNALILRVKQHADLLACLQHSSIPIINGLSDESHPCQALADIMTVLECKSQDAKIVYVGDGNNVCQSLIDICSVLTLNLTVITPEGHAPKHGRSATITHDMAACSGADVLYTDVWMSMGQDAVSLTAFKPYQINTAIMQTAHPNAIVMHCLPAVRGEEITASVLTGSQSVVFQQAENRMYAQQAIMIMLMRRSLWKQWY
jgi:ornithine carbamoyltransferase|tara:strand:+ start:1139 stop:2023 length:885 start_codon:yes stop_codon:yes gene_type:complete